MLADLNKKKESAVGTTQPVTPARSSKLLKHKALSLPPEATLTRASAEDVVYWGVRMTDAEQCFSALVRLAISYINAKNVEKACTAIADIDSKYHAARREMEHIPANVCIPKVLWPLHVPTALHEMIVAISAVAAQRRAAMAPAAGPWIPPSTFIRHTDKYWMAAEAVNSIKLQVLSHLPILELGTPSAGPVALEARGVRTQVHNYVSSVYLDTEGLECYHQRLRHEEGASLYRVRWYGGQTTGRGVLPSEGSQSTCMHLPGPSTPYVFIERKIHHENSPSSKDRFPVPLHRLDDFMRGEMNAEECIFECQQMTGHGLVKDEHAFGSLVKLARRVQAVIKRRKLKPRVRTCYHRTAFQSALSNDVRVTMDYPIFLVKEKDRPDFWSTLDSIPCPTAVFAHGILEIKTALDVPPPAWVSDLLRAGSKDKTIRFVEKFSKYQHAIATHCPKFVRTTPYWLTPSKKERRRVAATQGSRVVMVHNIGPKCTWQQLKSHAVSCLGEYANTIEYVHILDESEALEAKLRKKALKQLRDELEHKEASTRDQQKCRNKTSKHEEEPQVAHEAESKKDRHLWATISFANHDAAVECARVLHCSRLNGHVLRARLERTTELLQEHTNNIEEPQAVVEVVRPPRVRHASHTQPQPPDRLGLLPSITKNTASATRRSGRLSQEESAEMDRLLDAFICEEAQGAAPRNKKSMVTKEVRVPPRRSNSPKGGLPISRADDFAVRVAPSGTSVTEIKPDMEVLQIPRPKRHQYVSVESLPFPLFDAPTGVLTAVACPVGSPKHRAA